MRAGTICAATVTWLPAWERVASAMVGGRLCIGVPIPDSPSGEAGGGRTGVAIGTERAAPEGCGEAGVMVRTRPPVMTIGEVEGGADGAASPAISLAGDAADETGKAGVVTRTDRAGPGTAGDAKGGVAMRTGPDGLGDGADGWTTGI
jgi:hypothetical protein